MYRVIKASAQLGRNRAYASREVLHEGEWELVRCKDVRDRDGFITDYALYYNPVTDTYICMFGDRDIYEPDEVRADFVSDREAEALEWFANYRGPGDDEDDVYSAEEITAKETESVIGTGLTIQAADQLEMNDPEVLNLLGRRSYDQLYKNACMKVDDEIVNAFGEVEVSKWTNGGCTGRDNGDNTITITSKIYADFTSDRGKAKQAYAELRCRYDGARQSLDPKVEYFTDELDYE